MRYKKLRGGLRPRMARFMSKYESRVATNLPGKFNKGDLVIVLEGPLKGLIAEIQYTYTTRPKKRKDPTREYMVFTQKHDWFDHSDIVREAFLELAF